MAGFKIGAEDWGLHAIVRESSGEFPKFCDLETNDDHYSASPLFDLSAGAVSDHDFFPLFPEVFETSKDDQLEDLYKPFYQVPPHPLPSSTVIDFQERNPDDEMKSSSGSDATATAPDYTPKYKRRKSHQKRVVIQVSAEGLTSDMWAWRKYGQKPIKGSPYPRSYYRCSSSKGCLARKQVEQSCTDPEKFIITYTAEHSHSQPTRRNSLAGTVRQKFPPGKITLKKENLDGESPKTLHHHRHESPASAWPLARRETNNKQHVSENQVFVKTEEEEEDHLPVSDLIFNQDFSGLEEFDDFF